MVAREIAGLTQSQIGKACHLTRTSIINIERGRQGVPLHTFVRLCAVLHISYKLALDGRSRG